MPHGNANMTPVIMNIDAEELAELRRLLSTQRAQKIKDREADSTSKVNRTCEHGCGHDENNIGNGYANNPNNPNPNNPNKAPWIGVTIKAPAGERGHGTNTEGRLGFKNEDILEHARITPKQWSLYMSSAHRLIGYHFDIMKSWTTNLQNNPDAWRLIISEMQDLHPRFLFHEGNWLIRHLTINHLTNMNRKFRKAQEDPDRVAYRTYLTGKTDPPHPTHIEEPTSKCLHKEAPAPTLLASRRTNTPALVPSSSRRDHTSSRVLDSPTNPASLQKSASRSRSVDLSRDSETEADFDPSDLYDSRPPQKKQKRGMQTEVPAYQPPAHQSERRSQRNHLHPLNSPTHAPTSKTRDDPKAASSKTLRGTRGTRQALSTPVDVDEQHDHTSAVSTRSRTGNGTCLKRKAQVLLAGSDSEDEVPPPRPQRQPRRINNPRNPYIDSPI